jgi:hypothetical protein
VAQKIASRRAIEPKRFTVRREVVEGILVSFTGV